MDLDDVTATIGRAVRNARLAQRWNLDQLAEQAGVSRRMLVQVEQGQSNPTIASLLALSDALGLGLPQLMAITNEPILEITRDRHAPVLWHGNAGGHAQLVAGTAPPNVVELWDWTLEAGEGYDGGPHAPGTRELIHVREGTVMLTVGDHTEILNTGDSASFAGTLPHTYAWSQPDNGGLSAPQTARFTLVVFEPNVQPAAADARSVY